MGNFDRGNRGGAGRSFGRRDQGGGRFDRPREMHQVICSNCGKETEVPFKPTGDRPVYCRECFAKMGGPEPRRSFGGGNRDSRPRSEERQGPGSSAQLDAINAKLDQLLKLLTLGSTSLTTSKEKVARVAAPEEKKDIVGKTHSKISGREKKVVKKVPAETKVEAPPETPEE